MPGTEKELLDIAVETAETKAGGCIISATMEVKEIRVIEELKCRSKGGSLPADSGAAKGRSGPVLSVTSYLDVTISSP